MRVLTASISILLITLLLSPIMAFAAVQPPPIQLFLNGKPLIAEVTPRIINNNTVVPIRIIAESLGSKVQWEERSRKVTVERADITIQLFIDKQNVIVNNKTFQIETAPSVIDGSTMLPLRFVSERLGVKVTWDDLTRSVFLYEQESDTKTAAANPVPAKDVKPAVNDTEKENDIKKDNDTKKDSDKAVEAPKNTDKPLEPVKDKPTNTIVTIPNQTGTISSSGIDSKQTTVLTLIRSIAVEGDQFIVKTSGGMASPTVTTLTNPHQIVIEIPNGQLDPALKLNANGEGTVTENSSSISQIRYLLFSKESSNVRIIIDVPNKVDFKSSAANSANQLAWTLLPAKDRYKVVIDPGHGGKDTGAISVKSRHEKDLVLSLGLKVANLLAKELKIEVHMTRKNDTFVELPGRVEMANDMKADLFVSIHANSVNKDDIRGIETYYYTEQSLPFARLMHQQLLKSSGFLDRKVKQDEFYVIKNTTMPSILLEVGFLSNKEEENILFQEGFQNQVAASLAAAIKQQLNID